MDRGLRLAYAVSCLICVALALVMFAAPGCATGGGGGAPADGDQTPDGNDNATENENTGDGQDEEYEYSITGDPELLEERLGGSAYTGDASSSVVDGTLFLEFAADGRAERLGGTILGEFFNIGDETEVILDLVTPAVTGTYRPGGSGSQPLENFLADTGQEVELLGSLITLVGDSLSIVIDYRTNLPGQTLGLQTMILEGTVRFETNADITGGLVLPGIPDRRVPEFQLLRQ